MSVAQRRLPPWVVLLAGLIAAVAVVLVAGHGRRGMRTESDLRIAAIVAESVQSRIDALAQAIRGPALSFDLANLRPDEIDGVLRLAYAQSEGVAAVTLLDREGHAEVPAVFVARAPSAGSASGHPVETLADLDRFSQRIPFADTLAHGRAVRGPYDTLRNDGVRLALGESIPVADGTDTRVLAAEVDVPRLIAPLSGVAGNAEVALIGPDARAGSISRLPPAVRSQVLAAAVRPVSSGGGATLGGATWRAAWVRAPGGLAGNVLVAWSGPGEGIDASRNEDYALGVIVFTVAAAIASALAVMQRAMRADEAREAERTKLDLAPAANEAQVLAAVVKELANPIAAASAAARLLGPDRGRAGDAVVRSTGRLERAFRRIVRLSRAGEERANATCVIGPVITREIAAVEAESTAAGITIASESSDGSITLPLDDDDATVLVQALLDAARTMAPAGSTVKVAVSPGPVLSVTDAGVTLDAARRRDLVTMAAGVRNDAAVPGLAWALAARIARESGGRFEARDVGETSDKRAVCVCVTYRAG